jgi:hypothetical protein
MTSSQSDEVNLAVGFNPRFAEQSALAVAERRLNSGVSSNASGVATRRQTVWSIAIRGLKPAATLTTSLREATPQGSWSQCALKMAWGLPVNLALTKCRASEPPDCCRFMAAMRAKDSVGPTP